MHSLDWHEVVTKYFKIVHSSVVYVSVILCSLRLCYAQSLWWWSCACTGNWSMVCTLTQACPTMSCIRLLPSTCQPQLCSMYLYCGNNILYKCSVYVGCYGEEDAMWSVYTGWRILQLHEESRAHIQITLHNHINRVRGQWFMHPPLYCSIPCSTSYIGGCYQYVQLTMEILRMLPVYYVVLVQRTLQFYVWRLTNTICWGLNSYIWRDIHLRHTIVQSCYQKVYTCMYFTSIISLCNLRYDACENIIEALHVAISL